MISTEENKSTERLGRAVVSTLWVLVHVVHAVVARALNWRSDDKQISYDRHTRTYEFVKTEPEDETEGYERGKVAGILRIYPGILFLTGVVVLLKYLPAGYQSVALDWIVGALMLLAGAAVYKEVEVEVREV